jgi:phosphohistidine phosphatase
MKRVILVRHAKAVPYGYEDDFNRELTERGCRDAVKISSRLSGMGISPELMISSPAARALQTAMIFTDAFQYGPDLITQEPGLYMEFATRDFVQYLAELSAEHHTVCVFGHNPSITYYASGLAGGFSGDMPTCSAVGIDFNIENWSQIESRSGTVAFHLVPRML